MSPSAGAAIGSGDPGVRRYDQGSEAPGERRLPGRRALRGRYRLAWRTAGWSATHRPQLTRTHDASQPEFAPISLAYDIERLRLSQNEVLHARLGRCKLREVCAGRIELRRSEIRLNVGVDHLDLSDDPLSPDDDINIEPGCALALVCAIENAPRVPPGQKLLGEQSRHEAYVVVRIAQRILDSLKKLKARARIDEVQ
jgi:hypothetical protein